MLLLWGLLFVWNNGLFNVVSIFDKLIGPALSDLEIKICLAEESNLIQLFYPTELLLVVLVLYLNHIVMIRLVIKKIIVSIRKMEDRGRSFLSSGIKNFYLISKS